MQELSEQTGSKFPFNLLPLRGWPALLTPCHYFSWELFSSSNEMTHRSSAAAWFFMLSSLHSSWNAFPFLLAFGTPIWPSEPFLGIGSLCLQSHARPSEPQLFVSPLCTRQPVLTGAIHKGQPPFPSLRCKPQEESSCATPIFAMNNT